MDHRLLARVDLLAKVGDVDLDDARATPEVVAPDAVENLRLAHDGARVAHEEAQELELRGRQVDRAVSAVHFITELVEREVTDAHDGVGRTRDETGRATDEPTKPRDDLLEAERLGDIVIPARRETGDAFVEGVLRRQEQDRHVVAPAAGPLEHLEAIDVGQHDVEHDDVGVELADELDRRLAVARRAHVPALIAQRHRHELGERRLVVDHDRPHGRTVGVCEGRSSFGHASIMPTKLRAAYEPAVRGWKGYWLLKAASKDCSGSSHNSERMKPSASCAPWSRSMPASSHSIEIGPR